MTSGRAGFCDIFQKTAPPIPTRRSKATTTYLAPPLDGTPGGGAEGDGAFEVIVAGVYGSLPVTYVERGRASCRHGGGGDRPRGRGRRARRSTRARGRGRHLRRGASQLPRGSPRMPFLSRPRTA